MSESRLSTALDQEGLVLPEGPVAVMRAPEGYDLGSLDAKRLVMVHEFWPDYEAAERAGLVVATELPDRLAAVVVVVPRAKALAQDMVAAAASKARLVIVDGQKTDGIDSLFKECRARLGDLPSVTKAHGRLFWFEGGVFDDWNAGEPQKGPHGYFTIAGVFSVGEIDKASALLAAALPAKLPARMADFGAGWGFLSKAVLERDGIEQLDLIEAELRSLDCARLNILDPRASFHWADATRWTPAAPYGGIVMNPPFHTSRAADPGLGRAFIAAAARSLTPSGHLWMVANRHLPYEAALRDLFREVAEIGGDGSFKVFHASRPKK